MSGPPLSRGQALDNRRFATCPRPPNPLRWFVLRQFLQTPPDRTRRHAGCHRHRGNATITRSKRLRRRDQTTAPFVENGAIVENRSRMGSTSIAATTWGTVCRVCRNTPPLRRRGTTLTGCFPWRCAGPVLPCRRQPRAFAGAKPTGNSRHCARLSQLTTPSIPPTVLLNRVPRPANLFNRQCLPSKSQQRPGTPSM